MITIINLVKTLDIKNDGTIFLMLTIDCFLFGLFSAFTTMIYFWYLELALITYKDYLVAASIIMLHLLACYNYALTIYTYYSKEVTLNEFRKNKLI